jgi:prepilin-type N-terminal cleavage/methylation domain-containing protein
MKLLRCTGASLLEVLIALAIFSTALLGGGFAAMQSLKHSRTAMQHTQALLAMKSQEESRKNNA